MFGVVGRRETDSNLAYLLVGLPVGIAYYAALVTGVSLGVGLLPVVVGVPILAATVGAAGYVGVIDAELLGRVRGRQVSYGPTDPSESSVVG